MEKWGNIKDSVGGWVIDFSSMSREVLGYAFAIVVTVPDDPLNFSAPASTYSTPPPVGFVVGTVVALAIPITLTPLPNWSVVPIPTLPVGRIKLVIVPVLFPAK